MSWIRHLSLKREASVFIFATNVSCYVLFFFILTQPTCSKLFIHYPCSTEEIVMDTKNSFSKIKLGLYAIALLMGGILIYTPVINSASAAPPGDHNWRFTMKRGCNGEKFCYWAQCQDWCRSLRFRLDEDDPCNCTSTFRACFRYEGGYCQ